MEYLFALIAAAAGVYLTHLLIQHGQRRHQGQTQPVSTGSDDGPVRQTSKTAAEDCAGLETTESDPVKDSKTLDPEEIEEVLAIMDLAARLGYGRFGPRGCMVPGAQLQQLRAIMSDDEIVAAFEAAEETATTKPDSNCTKLPDPNHDKRDAGRTPSNGHPACISQCETTNHTH